ncbi:MAG: UDP-N-acetylmuramate dehydrogenase [Legionella sp.]
MIIKPFNLKTYNTFGFSVNAFGGVVILTVAQLRDAMMFARANRLPIVPIGGGSNIILKNNLAHLALIIRIPGIELMVEDERHVYIRVGAGVEWDDLVAYSLAQGWFGLENLSIIPGTVGACPIQNVGAYGVEIKDFLHELSAFDSISFEEKKFTNRDCRFQYRNSVFKNEYKDKYIITSVTFRLNKQPAVNVTDINLQKELSAIAKEQITPQLVRQAVIAVRTRRLPKVADIGNAGSFYMNPIVNEQVFTPIFHQYNNLLFTRLGENQFKISAGWLIDQCGWKGYRENSVGVYEHNPLILVNFGAGTGDLLVALSQKIQDSVYNNFGVNLIVEPRIYD